MTNYTQSTSNTQTTGQRVLTKLASLPTINVEDKGEGRYRLSGTPWRNGSDSKALALEIAADGEHGTWFDHRDKEGGSLYDFAARIDVQIPSSEPEATFDYYNEHGELVMQVVRSPGKKFWQRQPDGADGWINSTTKPKVRRPPYRLADIIAHPDSIIFIVEGEKDADTAKRMGILATCNPGGAKNWKTIYPDYLGYFNKRHVVIIPDNDESGIEHVHDVAMRLSGIAASIKILDPLGESERYDLTDWANDGGTSGKLYDLGKNTPEYQPSFKDRTTRMKEAGLDSPPELPVLTPQGIKEAEITTWADIADLLGPIEWEWESWLAKGFQTLVASMSGDGKSCLLLRIAACYILGRPWPDGGNFSGERGKVLWCETEAAQALNIDRARKWGISLDKIINPTSNLLEDIELDNPAHQIAVSNMAQRDDVKLVIVDSLSGGTTGRNNKDSSDMLGVGKWLAELARDTNKPVTVSHHLRKKSIFDGDKINLDRLRDSSSIVQTARVVWAIDAPDYEYPEQKRLYVIKSNLGRFPESIGLEIYDDRIEFGEVPEPPQDDKPIDRAIDLLLSLLKKQPMSYEDIELNMLGAGISMETARRAKKKLHVSSNKVGDKWVWSLPVRE